MPTYSNGKIYMIRSPSTDRVYIGSTTLSISQRLAEHRRTHRFYSNGNKTNRISSYDILDFGDAYIELVKLFPCSSKEELVAEEYKIIRETENCVNKKKGIYTTIENWKEQNKEHIKQYSQEYEANRRADRLSKITCSCGAVVSKQNITSHKKTKKHLFSETVASL